MPTEVARPGPPAFGRPSPTGISASWNPIYGCSIKWYEVGWLSQSKAAEVAGISRSEFLNALARFGVSPFQYTAEEIIAEVSSE